MLFFVYLKLIFNYVSFKKIFFVVVAQQPILGAGHIVTLKKVGFKNLPGRKGWLLDRHIPLTATETYKFDQKDWYFSS